MFMPYMEHLDPVNFLCTKCLENRFGRELIVAKSSLKHIREDMGGKRNHRLRGKAQGEDHRKNQRVSGGTGNISL